MLERRELRSLVLERQELRSLVLERQELRSLVLGRRERRSLVLGHIKAGKKPCCRVASCSHPFCRHVVLSSGCQTANHAYNRATPSVMVAADLMDGLPLDVMGNNCN